MEDTDFENLRLRLKESLDQSLTERLTRWVTVFSLGLAATIATAFVYLIEAAENSADNAVAAKLDQVDLTKTIVTTLAKAETLDKEIQHLTEQSTKLNEKIVQVTSEAQKARDVLDAVQDVTEADLDRLRNAAKLIEDADQLINSGNVAPPNFSIDTTYTGDGVHRSRRVPLETITEKCGDEDGCLVSLAMSNWSPDSVATNAVSSRGPWNFFFDEGTLFWRTGTDVSGTVGDGVPAYAFIAWGCLFGEASYDQNKPHDDTKDFHIMAFGNGPRERYPVAGKTCAVHIRD